jgi:diguanylate cyclase (GGDEF)-like protein
VDSRQQIRVERVRIGIAATLMTMGMTVAISLAGFLAMQHALVFVGGAGLLGVVFYALIRSGANLRFRDPSLTVPMLLSSGALITYLVLTGPLVRPAFISFYLIAFMFGVLTLDTRRLVMVAVAYAGYYAAMIAISVQFFGEPAQRELFRLLFFSLLLAWFTILGSYISGLRANLRKASEDLGTALVRAEELATTDPLTGCSNRRQILARLDLEAARAGRGEPFCVCLADLDHFKSINDVHGHAAGDEVLVAFVAAARQALRPTDSLGRWGGEEFLFVLAQTRRTEAARAAERLRALIEATPTIPALPFGTRVTVSIGVVEYLAGESALQAVGRADQALYAAKQAGRNRVEVGP